MQFLVYLTVLMVSVSTVLLELHWLTSPPPQPKAMVRTAAPVPVPKADGPNVQLSPIYPTKVDPPQSEQSASAQQPQTSNNASNNNASNSKAKSAPQGAGNETTGVAPRKEEKDNASNTPTPAPSQPNNNVPNRSVANAAPPAQPIPRASQPTSQPSSQPQSQAVSQPSNEQPPAQNKTASNKCDVQACASAYKSFRSDDCTYQPFDGPRRFCASPPVQRTARDQREDRDRRSWVRDDAPRYTDRRARWRNYDDDDERAIDMDDDDDGGFIIRRIRRW